MELYGSVSELSPCRRKLDGVCDFQLEAIHHALAAVAMLMLSRDILLASRPESVLEP